MVAPWTIAYDVDNAAKPNDCRIRLITSTGRKRAERVLILLSCFYVAEIYLWTLMGDAMFGIHQRNRLDPDIMSSLMGRSTIDADDRRHALSKNRTFSSNKYSPMRWMGECYVRNLDEKSVKAGYYVVDGACGTIRRVDNRCRIDVGIWEKVRPCPRSRHLLDKRFSDTVFYVSAFTYEVLSTVCFHDFYTFPPSVEDMVCVGGL